MSNSDSSVGIVSRLWAAQPKNCGGLIPSRVKKFLSSLKCPDQLWGSPSLSLSGYQRVLSLGVKQQ